MRIDREREKKQTMLGACSACNDNIQINIRPFGLPNQTPNAPVIFMSRNFLSYSEPLRCKYAEMKYISIRSGKTTANLHNKKQINLQV